MEALVQKRVFEKIDAKRQNLSESMAEEKISRREQRGQKRFEFDPSKPKDISPGEMFRQIKVPSVEISSEEKALEKKKLPMFVSFCKWALKAFPSFGKKASFTQRYREAVEFLNWPLTAEEFSAASKLVLFSSVLLGLILGIILMFFSPVGEVLADYTGLGEYSAFFIFVPIIIAVILFVNYVQNYPINAAKIEQYKSLTYVPEIVGYMIMSMKLVPNLEKAVEFAAQHGRGRISLELQEIIWKVQLGIYGTLAEGLDDLAYRWGKFSSEFKQALMMIRASVLETSDAKRYAVLDKTMDSVLESVRNKMEQYARDLSQPSIILFYLGVLLPLILIIVLPVGSAFSGQPMARPEVLVLIYNILIPALCIVFARNVLLQRPPTYEPPRIPKNSALIPPEGRIPRGKSFISINLIVAGILVVGVLASVGLSAFGLQVPSFTGEQGLVLLAPDKNAKDVLAGDARPEFYFEESSPTGALGPRYAQLLSLFRGEEDKALIQLKAEKQQYFIAPEHDITPYNLLYGLIITFSFAIAAKLYFSSIYKRKVQLEAMQMESEFKDSLYIIASRMGENKPIEDALRHAKEFLPNMVISERLFGRTVDNITVLGMPLEAAIFDPVYGSLKDNPSNIIRSSMQLVVDSVELGVNVAARTLMSLSLQLTNSEKVSKMLSVLVSDISSMMKTMAVFIAPIVLGITTSLQKVVMLTLGSIVASDLSNSVLLGEGASAEIPGLGSFTSFSNAFAINKDVFATMVNPSQFILIVALYVFEIVIIMVYFTTRIEEDNDVLVKLNIAKALPIAAIVFVASVILSNSIVGGFG